MVSRNITVADVNGSNSCTITEPGYYTLSEDIDWQTTDPNSRAIAIMSDDVTLDLGGKTLRQINQPDAIVESDPSQRVCKGEVISGNVGIWAEGRKGVTIKNGNVLGIQGVGIALKDCHQVELNGLTVKDCGGQGAIDTSFLCRNGGIFVMGTKMQDDKIQFSSDVRMLDCICLANTSQLDFVVTLGALVLFCDRVEVKNCAFNHTANSSPEPSGVQFNVVGIDFVICRNVVVSDCEAHDNTSGGEPAGFFAWGENYKFQRCRSHRNYTLTGNRACGFNISTTSNLTMIDCEADRNYNANPKAQDCAAAGYRIGKDVKRGLIENCRAIANYSISTEATAAGFLLDSSHQIILQNCVANQNDKDIWLKD
jgi:hypothetical protein